MGRTRTAREATEDDPREIEGPELIEPDGSTVPPKETQDYEINLGTAEIDGFIGILEEVLEPLSERVKDIEDPSRFEVFGIILQVVRKNALPSMVVWMAEVANEPVEVLDNSIMLQSKVLKACREQGLGDFLSEWLALLGPILR